MIVDPVVEDEKPLPPIRPKRVKAMKKVNYSEVDEEEDEIIDVNDDDSDTQQEDDDGAEDDFADLEPKPKIARRKTKQVKAGIRGAEAYLVIMEVSVMSVYVPPSL
jgi:hypothetical protein